MERLFSPCTRLHDILDSQGLLEDGPDAEPLQELHLDVSTEEFLSAERAFTYADLYALLGNEETVVWLTPHAAVVRGDGEAMRYWDQLDGRCRFWFRVDDEENITAVARSSEHLLDIVDVVVRLLAVSIVQAVRFTDGSSVERIFINAPTLAYMMEQCQSLKVLTLVNQEMNEDHCRLLGDFSRPGLAIVLRYCKITNTGASALAEILGRNQGLTKLDYCEIDNSVIADGLRGNSSLKSVKPRLPYNREDGNRELVAIAGALRENRGLVYLDLSYGFRMSEETWGAICDSLKTHPTLEVLTLRATTGRMAPPAPAVLKFRIQKLVDMLKVNMSIHTIHLHDLYSNHELYRESVIPYLETNWFRPRLLAIQKAHPIAYRAKILGRALLAVRTNPNRVWMLLSGNAEVAFPSDTTATVAAANSPTPGTATTVPDSLPTAAAASAATPSTASASDAFALTIAANVATTPAGQKRKSRP
jgi:hypothetical protein